MKCLDCKRGRRETMDNKTRTMYQKLRSEGYSARDALAIAKARIAAKARFAGLILGSSKPYSMEDRFIQNKRVAISVSIVHDENPNDLIECGSVRVDYERSSDVTRRPEPHSYYSFERRAWLTYIERFNAPHGMAKEPARLWVQRQRRELARVADSEYADLYGLIVRSTWNGIDIGESSLWSVYATHDDLTGIADAFVDFADDAAAQADKWLADMQKQFVLDAV